MTKKTGKKLSIVSLVIDALILTAFLIITGIDKSNGFVTETGAYIRAFSAIAVMVATNVFGLVNKIDDRLNTCVFLTLFMLRICCVFVVIGVTPLVVFFGLFVMVGIIVTIVKATRQSDNGTKIKAEGRNWQQKHEDLWKKLVPEDGHAETVQGEIVRITGKVTREILDNGGINWDDDYKLMTASLAKYFDMGTSEDIATNAKKIIPGINENSGKDELYKLTELAIKWIEKNPEPIRLDKVDYKR